MAILMSMAARLAVMSSSWSQHGDAVPHEQLPARVDGLVAAANQLGVLADRGDGHAGGAQARQELHPPDVGLAVAAMGGGRPVDRIEHEAGALVVPQGVGRQPGGGRRLRDRDAFMGEGHVSTVELRARSKSSVRRSAQRPGLSRERLEPLGRASAPPSAPPTPPRSTRRPGRPPPGRRRS